MTTATIPRSSYFYPRSPRGERPGAAAPPWLAIDFYPRSPRGERLHERRGDASDKKFLSTLPARGATDTRRRPNIRSWISIHAPREGSDWVVQTHYDAASKISIHAPREGSDITHIITTTFLLYFYPRSPRGERPDATSQRCAGLPISIHAPREGSDMEGSTGRQQNTKFLSTLPARGATHFRAVDEAVRWISIHAPREGSDSFSVPGVSLPPPISIHAPREGSDPAGRTKGRKTGYFYPRSPRGERPQSISPTKAELADFYPRSPRGERQQMC